uniref:Uncharacterized protein n=1 Tax=Rhizophora mucronata TaxID=61149 RepID=A0A2P2KGV6_RHIMU
MREPVAFSMEPFASIYRKTIMTRTTWASMSFLLKQCTALFGLQANH